MSKAHTRTWIPALAISLAVLRLPSRAVAAEVPPAVAAPTPGAPALVAAPQPAPHARQLLTVHLETGLFKGSPVEIKRDGLALPDLRLAVAESRGAAALMNHALEEQKVGTILGWTAAALVVGSFIPLFAIPGDAANANGTTNSRAAPYVGAFAGILLGGLITAIVGGAFSHNGFGDELEAVNSYNHDLLLGQLSATPSP